MRILIVCNIPPWANGGAETQAMKLGLEWRKLGHEVVIAGQLIPTTTLRRDGVHIQLRHIPFVKWTRTLRAVSYSLGLAWFIGKHYRGFDIVYCRFVREAAVVLSLVKRFFNLEFNLVLCSACAMRGGCAEFLVGLPWSKSIINSIDASATIINNISDKTGEELSSVGLNNNKFCYIGNGTTVPDQYHAFKDGKKLRLVCVCRLASNKGHTCLIEAIGLLRQKGVHIDMTFIGAGPERQKLESLVSKRNLQNNIQFLGYINNDQIFNHLIEYDIFVLASESEGFATVVIEAMAAGLPVIVTRSGGPEYFVDNTVGRTCETKNAQALMLTIQELLEMKTNQLQELGIRGRRRVMDRFEISSIAKQYEKIFIECNSKL